MAQIVGTTAEELTFLEHTCRLNFIDFNRDYLLTTLGATISVASQSTEILTKMIAAGMRIVRLNLSHDTLEFHAETIRMLREVIETMSKERGYMVDVAIAIDTKGPEIRTGLLEAGPNAEVELKTNDNVRLSTNPDLFDKGNREVIFVDYPNIINVLQVGQIVYINDGAVKLVVKEVGVDCISCVVERGGIFGSRKKVNVPGAIVDLPAVSERDRNDLKFAIEQQVDMVFATAMRSADAVNELRKILKDKGKYIKLIAKIDCLQGLENFDEILEAADGILFVRSDLAIEIPSAKVFLAQKAIVARCNRAGKPCIVSTEVLESLRSKVRPTRAEIADLGNVVLDGADAILLSSETSIGVHPDLAIRTMGNIMREAQSAIWYRSVFNDLIAQNLSSIDAAHSVAIAAVDASIKTMATAIIVLTTSGRSAQLVAKYKPNCAILAVTRCPRTARQCHLNRGIVPLLYTEPPPKHWLENKDSRIQYALNVGRRMNLVKTGDPVVVVSPWKEGTGFTNTMHLIYAFYEPEDFTDIIDPEAKSRKSSVVQNTP